MSSGREFHSWDPLNASDFLYSSVFARKRCRFWNPLVIRHPAVSLLTNTGTSLMYSGPCLLTHQCTRAILSSLLLTVNGVHFRVALRSELYKLLSEVVWIILNASHSYGFVPPSVGVLLCTNDRPLSSSLNVGAPGHCNPFCFCNIAPL